MRSKTLIAIAVFLVALVFLGVVAKRTYHRWGYEEEYIERITFKDDSGRVLYMINTSKRFPFLPGVEQIDFVTTSEVFDLHYSRDPNPRTIEGSEWSTTRVLFGQRE